MNVVRATQCKLQQPGTDGVVAESVDEYKATGLAVLAVRVEGDAAIQAQVADADLVEFQLLGSQVLKGVDVDLVARRGDGRRHGTRAHLQQVRATRQHRLFMHPDQRRLKLIGHTGWMFCRNQQVTAADIDLTI